MNRMPRRLLAAALAAAVLPPAAVVAQDAASSSMKAPAADAAFVKQASAAGLAEVALGQLGADKGQSQDTKTFGQQMVTDHTKANDELTRIAGTKGLTPSSEPMPADQKAAKAIEAKSGDAFDKAFAAKMVADHKKAVALFTKESTSGKDPELKAFATQTLPTLKQHLEMAQQLGGGKDAGRAMASH